MMIKKARETRGRDITASSDRAEAISWVSAEKDRPAPWEGPQKSI